MGILPMMWRGRPARLRQGVYLLAGILLSALSDCIAPAVRAADAPSIQIRAGKTDTHGVADSVAPEGEVREAPPSPTLATALSLKTGLPFDERLAVVHALPAILSPDHIVALTAFVSARSGPAGLDAGEIYALKNDAINALTRQQGFVEKLVPILAGVYADRKQDAVMRDYALQHLAVIALDGSKAYKWVQHWQAVGAADAEPELAATAMLHLVSASEKNSLSAAQKQKLESAALRMASDKDKPDVSRITALQVCTRLKVSAARQLAFSLAQSPEAGFPLRISAIAALGDLGQGDERIVSLLKNYADGGERRLRVPARSALQHIQH
ncbi:hypothetical protein OPIT5_23625 [Opitutaceae bacterium TAV5]|nr:hypothetical protein OPIT5_23625 [Opitutaceae bacterium TAV5]